MKVGWLTDDPGYIGGAEMTQAEFQSVAPDSVEIVPCPPGEIKPADRYVANNIVHYSLADFAPLDAPITWYHHDLSAWIQPDVQEHLNRHASHIFCSPIQRDRYGLDGKLIPPMADERFRPTRQAQRNGHRQGTCSVAQWRTPSKGSHLLEEWAAQHGEVEVFGPGPFMPSGPNIKPMGEMDPLKMPQLLWSYERFVFLPIAPEPFGRAVMEAATAGLEVITNRLVGAVWWMENEPKKLRTAGRDFWKAVLA
jgi:hypothetical protein